MNQITLKGTIRHIEYSHSIGDVIYEKAELVVPKGNGEDDIFPIKYKKYSNKYVEGDTAELVGNLRTFSETQPDGKNKVHIYTFTYFDFPKHSEEEGEITNRLVFDGRICKLDQLHISKFGKQSVHFLIANNIISESNHQKLNTYIPCVLYGAKAKEVSEYKISDSVSITGKLNSRIYEKRLDNGEIEFRTAYECIVSDIQKLS